MWHHVPLPRPLGLTAAVSGALLSVTAPSCGSDPLPGDGQAVVEHVVDGDTVVVDIAGRSETVRLIGVDTPETKHPDRPVECFGPEASARLDELLPAGSAVRLERDVEARDRYGRLLAYVYRADDDVLVNLVLAEEGYADTAPFPPNTTRSAELAGAVSEARQRGAGRWSACGGADAGHR